MAKPSRRVITPKARRFIQGARTLRKATAIHSQQSTGAALFRQTVRRITPLVLESSKRHENPQGNEVLRRARKKGARGQRMHVRQATQAELLSIDHISAAREEVVKKNPQAKRRGLPGNREI